jgi:hypothetical protein
MRGIEPGQVLDAIVASYLAPTARHRDFLRGRLAGAA